MILSASLEYFCTGMHVLCLQQSFTRGAMSGYDTDEDDMEDEEDLEDEEEDDDDDEGWVSDVSGGAEVTVRPIKEGTSGTGFL